MALAQTIMSSNELEAIYDRRFKEHISYRSQIWRTLVQQFFSRFIQQNAKVLDLGCGYGEFINNVRCADKYAMDLNSRAREYLNKDVTFFEQDCSAKWPLPDNSLDVVFTSNFFEHLVSKQALSETSNAGQEMFDARRTYHCHGSKYSVCWGCLLGFLGSPLGAYGRVTHRNTTRSRVRD